jgi:CRISPR-associated protein Csc3
MNHEQLPLSLDLDDLDDLPILDLDSGREEDDLAEQPELLTVRLFKQAICEVEGNQGDLLLANFAEDVLPKLMQQLAGSTAKGGLFFERLDERGKIKKRDNAGDQSLPAHLINGFFPTYRIAKRLQQPDTSKNQVKSYCEDLQLRIYVASYLLHDYEKFPNYQSWLIEQDTEEKWKDRDWVKLSPNKKDAPNLGRDYVVKKIVDLGLDKFLGESWQEFLDDIIWISNNAGDKYDADLGLTTRGLTLLDDDRLDGRIRNVLVNLVKLSDRFASLVKHPQDILKINDLLKNLSNENQFQFTYHALSDNRGVLTNIINNALMDLHPKEFYTQLLYLPDGVVYLAKTDAPTIDVDKLPDRVIETIINICKRQITIHLTGFDRDSQKRRLKLASYFDLLFSPIEIIQKLAVKAVFKFSQPLDKLPATFKEKQKAGEISPNLDIDSLIFDGRVDRLGKLLVLISSLSDDRDRKVKVSVKILTHLDLSNFIDEFNSFVDSGGTIYRWFYIASRFYESRQNTTPDEERLLLENISKELSQKLAHRLQVKPKELWEDLRSYVKQIVSLPTGFIESPSTNSFFEELNRYQLAKRTDSKRKKVCAMSSSSFTVIEQEAPAMLFAPQVYSNRQILLSNSKNDAKRHICLIWSIEIMLRQVLMKQVEDIGGDFEDRKYRFLYLYPTYFFTPETNKFLQKAYSFIRSTKFNSDIRKHLISEDDVANFEIENYQSVDSLLLQENSETKGKDIFKIDYPEDQPLTFFFMAMPPQVRYENGKRKIIETESWVMPSWLAFALPLVLDVKVVASESPVPPYISGADFEPTTVLDGEHQAIATLVKKKQYRLDAILPRNSPHTFSPLNALSAAYCIHLEVNRKKDGDPDWGKLAALARDLETSPLYVFHYLSKLIRKLDWDTAPVEKIKLYVYFYRCFDPEGEAMNQLRKLTQLYRCFYRAKSQYAKSNAVLKPIDEAADVILKIDKALVPDEQSLTDVVAARISKLMTNVRRRTAEGKPTLILVDGKWKPALTSEEERQAIYEFAQFFVKDLFLETFKGDRARLAGTQLNLIRDTCDYLYRLEDDLARKSARQPEPEELPEAETESV